MDNKEIIDALAKIPELVKAAETFKRTTDKTIATLAEAVKQRPQAVIPESELNKLSERISKTKCAPPELEPAGRLLASNISVLLTPIIAEKAKKALDGAAVEVRHTHAYCFEKDLKEVADKRLIHRIFILWIIICASFAIITFSAFDYLLSDTYWAQEFQEVYSSKYLTDEERAMIKDNSYPAAVLPVNYRKDPEYSQHILKKDKRIIKQRMKESLKKGTYTPNEAIQWP